MKSLLLLLLLAPPPTRVDDFTETLHGVVVPDPYRWLEDQQSPETRRWIDAQNAYTSSLLKTRPDVLKRLDELTSEATVGTPFCRGNYCYVSRRAAGAQVSVLYRRGVASGSSSGSPGTTDASPVPSETAIFDPDKFTPGKPLTASFLAISDDSTLLAYSLRRGGEDETEIRFRNLASGQDLPIIIARHLNRGFALRRDGKGCYYTDHNRETGPRIHYLDLAAGERKLIFGEGFKPSQFIGPRLFARDKYLLITASQGWASNDLYWMDLAKDAAPRPIVKGVSAHFNAIDAGDRLLIHTDHNAPRYHLFSASYDRPEQSAWTEIVPQQEDPIEGVTVAGGKLYLEYLHNVTTRISIHSLDGKRAGEIPLPPLSTASLNGQHDQPIAYVTFTNLVTPTTIFQYDTATGAQKPYFRAVPQWNAAAYEVKQVWCKSRDGTRVPIFVAHRKGLQPDATAPALLTGYGGFNVSLLPRFSVLAAVWMEKGGVYALANIRGGAEFGEEWHRAGMLANKQNVFDDFIAAGEWLVASKYSHPGRLAVMGGSNGGLLVGAALTQRPELYRAVLCSYPDLDMVGYWRFPNNNKPALLEYGDASKSNEFEFLLKYSPYQNVKKATKYPAILLTSGDRDTRVPPLQARKMTARLQAASSSGLPVLLHYETDAGHVGASARSQQLEPLARNLSFLLWQLEVP